MKQKMQRDASRLIWLCAAVYFCSYLSRLNYSAVMVEMISSEGFTKAGASAALTGLFITYGIGQLISGYLGDKIRPHALIFVGLLASSVMNLLIPFCPGTGWMTVVWCVNGFAQAMMWPPLVRIMAGFLSADDYKKAIVRVSWGSSLGTVFIYLSVPLYITVGGWRLAFFVSAVLAAAMAFFWITAYSKVESRLTEHSPSGENCPAAEPAKQAGHSPVLVILALVMLAIVMQGILRDGITTWMPTYISETFRLKSAVSILTSVALPLFSILTFQVTALLNRKLLKNEMVCSAAIFAVGFLSLLLLKLAGTSSILVSVAMMTVSVGCMHGVNLILVCMVPKYFQNTGKTSLICGVLNSCTYVGSALSTYGMAVLTDRFGWNVTLGAWCAVALAGVLCCVFCARKWQRFRSDRI